VNLNGGCFTKLAMSEGKELAMTEGEELAMTEGEELAMTEDKGPATTGASTGIVGFRLA